VLRQRLAGYVREIGPQLGLLVPEEREAKIELHSRTSAEGREVEVMP
jgi:hypothetical protein